MEEELELECDCGTCSDCDIAYQTGCTPKEIEYLQWFACNADFGPAHDDVMSALQQAYEEETGNKVPKNWKLED